MLILKRAFKHRSGGPWDDDDYDVFDSERHVGRITWAHAAPADRRRLLELVAIYQRAADQLASPPFL
jgi:hypothetical protein